MISCSCHTLFQSSCNRDHLFSMTLLCRGLLLTVFLTSASAWRIASPPSISLPSSGLTRRCTICLESDMEYRKRMSSEKAAPMAASVGASSAAEADAASPGPIVKRLRFVRRLVGGLKSRLTGAEAP